MLFFDKFKKNLSPRKVTLTNSEKMILNAEMQKGEKVQLYTYAMWLLGGFFGLHRLYTRNYIQALFMCLTMGGFGIWWIVDVFFIGNRIDELNDELEEDLIDDILNARDIDEDIDLDNNDLENVMEVLPEYVKEKVYA